MTPDDAVRRLAAAGCVDPSGEVDEMARWAPQGFGGWSIPADWVRRRSLGEPLCWITGHAAFGGLDVRVARGVYPPRPWSADLALRAVSHLPVDGRLLDLCTGSGAVAALVADRRPGALVVGVDVDPAAAACARANGVPAVAGDLDVLVGAGVGSHDRPGRDLGFDVVTAVAPYVPSDRLHSGGVAPDVAAHEPWIALDGGPDGLALVRRVVGVTDGLLRPGGWLLVELGGDQDRPLAPDLVAAGFDDLTPWHDPDGDLLGMAARRRN